MSEAAPVPGRVYRFPPGVSVRISSPRRDVLSYFEQEYGPAQTEGADPRIDVFVGAQAAGPAGGWESRPYHGRHKTVTWRLCVDGLDNDVTSLWFDGRGEMAISFLQTFYLEPLLRMRVAECGGAMVHTGGIEAGGGCVLLVGGTGVGKTTIVTLHAARGGEVWGDNYVVVTPDGCVHRVPRRVRLYSDFRRANPEGYRRLSLRRRAQMQKWRLVRALSLGFASLPVRLPVHELAPESTPRPGGVPLKAVFVLTPGSRPEVSGPFPLPVERAIQRIQEISEEEAVRLMHALEPHLRDGHSCRWYAVPDREVSVLSAALAGLPAYEVFVPRVKDPLPVASRLLEISRSPYVA